MGKLLSDLKFEKKIDDFIDELLRLALRTEYIYLLP